MPGKRYRAGENTRRPGENIRQLALRRRIRAFLSFVSALAVLIFPWLLFQQLEKLVRLLYAAVPNQTSSATVSISTVYLLPFVLFALLFFLQGVVLWKRADRAAQGAQAEEEIGQDLSVLEQEGWQIEYGRMIGKNRDVDVICRSPKDNAYVIDVKSHRGQVFFNGGKLCRRMGKATYPFEKDFLQSVMQQALQVKQRQGLQFVTPILAFTQAEVTLPEQKVRGVYVVERSNLTALLQRLDRNQKGVVS